jgi:murein tripeptide amidase MpaA
MVIRMEITAAKIGRSIKKRENLNQLPPRSNPDKINSPHLTSLHPRTEGPVRQPNNAQMPDNDVYRCGEAVIRRRGCG